MGRQINLYQAKTQLSRLVDEAASGETIIIAKDGKPMAQLGPVPMAGKQPRQLGQLAENGKSIDWTQWWREWKAADKEIEADFEAAAMKGFPRSRQRPRRKRRP